MSSWFSTKEAVEDSPILGKDGSIAEEGLAHAIIPPATYVLHVVAFEDQCSMV